MFCCSKTGIQVIRCKQKVLTNITTPKSLGYAEHPVIFTGILPMVPQNSRHDDNFDEAGAVKYRTYILMLEESLYQANKWRVMDSLVYNDGQMANQSDFNPLFEKREGKIYSIREVFGSMRTGKKYREVKIRFDYQ